MQASVTLPKGHFLLTTGPRGGSIRVSPDGSTWTTVWERNADDRGPIQYFVDVSAELAGASDGYVRFSDIAPGWDWWGQGDNIQVCTSAGALGDADIEVVKTAQTTSTTTGRYTIQVQNLGPDDATGVVVTDMLPNGVAYVSDTCGGVAGMPWTWTIGDLMNGASVSCDITVDIIDPGDTTNVADASADQNDPNTGNNSGTAQLPPFGGPIPTLGSTGIALLIGLIAGFGLFLTRRLF